MEVIIYGVEIIKITKRALQEIVGLSYQSPMDRSWTALPGHKVLKGGYLKPISLV